MIVINGVGMCVVAVTLAVVMIPNIVIIIVCYYSYIILCKYRPQADQAVEEDVVMYRVKFSGPPGKFK